jgi:hypothetical protein
MTTKTTDLLCDVITAIEEYSLMGIPVVDEFGKMVGLYHKSEVSFIINATGPDSIMDNMKRLTVGEALVLADSTLGIYLTLYLSNYLSNYLSIGNDTLSSKKHALVTCLLRYF